MSGYTSSLKEYWNNPNQSVVETGSEHIQTTPTWTQKRQDGPIHGLTSAWS